MTVPFGIHDREGLHLPPEGGWVVDTVALSENPPPPDYTSLRKDINWLVRLNWGYGGTGTFPDTGEASRYIEAASNYIHKSRGVHSFILGNEPNHAQERPNGKYLTPEYCASIVSDVADLISNDARLMAPPIAPYHMEPMDWLKYMKEMLRLLDGWDVHLDGICIHAYTRSSNPADISSNAQMAPPLAGQYAGFRTYQDSLSVVPAGYKGLPAYITEFNELLDQGWDNNNTGVVKAVYQEIADWNAYQENQKVRAICLYRWPKHDKWYIDGKLGVIHDFQQAVEGGEPPTTPPPQDNTGVTIIPGSGSPVWRVSDTRFYTEGESGGRHHLYVDLFDESGQRVYGKKVLVTWPSGSGEILTESKTGDLFTNSGNFPFSPGRGAFSAKVVDGIASDTILGLGMGQETPSGFNPGVHTSWYVAWKRGESSTSTPPKPSAVVPPLVHPVSVPQFRRITQKFGENPQFYKRFSVDGVPLKGHNGVDYGVPVGIPILSVDTGTAVEVADDPFGYGKYVKLQHSWGQTLYAHLSTWAVSVGQQVEAGWFLGDSGNTGVSSGPHLHFGMRVAPFNRADGWGGYTDPLPYLAKRNPL